MLYKKGCNFSSRNERCQRIAYIQASYVVAQRTISDSLTDEC